MKRITFIFCLILLNSCTFLSGDKNLGSGYYFSDDAHFSCIIYSVNNPYSGSGLGVIPYEVTDYACDNNYIIATTLDDNNEVRSYWIIDKTHKIDLKYCKDQKSCDSVLKSNVRGPLDSKSFNAQLQQLGIQLELKERKNL